MRVKTYCDERYPDYFMYEADATDIERKEFVEISEKDWKDYQAFQTLDRWWHDRIASWYDKQPSWHFTTEDGVLRRTEQSSKEQKENLLRSLSEIGDFSKDPLNF